MGRNLQFYLRRLHGITGVFPIGYFLLFHLKEGESFSSNGIIYALIFLWLSLLWHGLYGMYISWEGTVNTANYGYLRNYMYLFQRISGILVFFFLISHIYIMKTGSMGSGIFYKGLLLSGVILSIFHLANGFFGFLIDLGITIGEKAQKVAVYFCFLTFVMLAVYGVQKYLQFVS